jgi:hypothetical protein
MTDFCVKLQKNASDTCALFPEAYRGETLKRSSVFQLHKHSKEDCDNVEDDNFHHFL